MLSKFLSFFIKSLAILLSRTKSNILQGGNFSAKPSLQQLHNFTHEMILNCSSDYSNNFNIENRKNFYRVNNITINPHRSEVRSISAIVNDHHKLLMCTVPKVASSSWTKFMLHLQFPKLNTTSGLLDYYKIYNKTRKQGKPFPNPHAIATNGVSLIATMTKSTALEYYSDANYLKVFHVRNPVTRILSAWLSKNSVSLTPLDFAKYHATFPAFVQNLSHYSELQLLTADPHIRPQYLFCDYNRGAHYDVILRFEHRMVWAPLLLDYLQRIHSFGTSQQKKMLYDIALGSHWTSRKKGADDWEVLLQHYDKPSLEIIRKMYHKDIVEFGYEKAVNLIATAL